MQTFILAGGFATRLWPLTEKRAKPLLPVASKPLLTHIVESLPPNMDVTVSTNATFEEGFRTWRKNLGQKNIDILMERTRNDDEKLGALGAVAEWIASEKIDDDLLVLTGDNYFGFSLAEFIEGCVPGRARIAAHDLGDPAKAAAFGTIILGEDKRAVARFEEKPKEPRTSLVSMGCICLPKSTLSIVVAYAKDHPDNLGSIIEELLRKAVPVDAWVSAAPWFDIGSFHSYLEATRAIVGTAILRGKGALIEASNCEGSVVLGERTTVHGSTIHDVVLFNNCIIENCVLQDCIIDDGCILRGIDLTGKMLRAGTILTQKPHSGRIARTLLSA